MKRFAALITALLFMTVCGCKSAGEYFSNFGGFIKEKFETAYDEVSKKAGDIGEGIVSIIENKPANKGDFIIIAPKKINAGRLSAYNKLTERQKELYSILVTAFSDMLLKKIDITDYASDNIFSELSVAHKAVLCDRPDIFWAPKTFSLFSYENADDMYICFRDDPKGNDQRGYFGITIEERDIMRSQLDLAVDAITASFASFNSDFEKELYIHDYICENVTYDDEAAADIENAETNSLTAYGALVGGFAVCEGYSKAFQLLCLKAGIPCSLVYGEHEDVAHMWNIAEIGGENYYVDTTFDDSSSVAVLHTYFNTKKSDMLKERIFYDEFIPGVNYDHSDNINFFADDCRAEAMNYFVKKGLILTGDFDSLIAAITGEMQAGKDHAELKNATNRSLESAFVMLKRYADPNIKLDYYYHSGNDIYMIVFWKN